MQIVSGVNKSTFRFCRLNVQNPLIRVAAIWLTTFGLLGSAFFANASPFPAGAGLGGSVCNAAPATNPYQDIGLRWEYNDWGGWNPNPSIDQSSIIASATPATFTNLQGAVNSYDLNLNADQIPGSYDAGTYFEYQFTTASFSDKAELTGAGFTLFEKAQPWHFQATGAYHVAILIDDDPAFGSPDVWFNDLAFDNADTSAASASTNPSDTGSYLQSFAHFDANGSAVELSPNTTYKMRVFPFDVTEYGDDNGQSYPNIVLWDDFMPKIISCSNPVAPASDTGTAVAGTMSTPIFNVAANDTIGGSPANLSGASGNAVVSQSGTWPLGFSLNPDGSIFMSNTVSAGTYTMTYELCDLSVPAQCNTATVEIVVENPPAPVPFPPGVGLSDSVCSAAPATSPWQDISFRWLYNDNGGSSPNAQIDNTNYFSSATPAQFSGLHGQVNNYDLNIDAASIPPVYDPSAYIQYQFTTAAFTDQLEITGAAFTLFEAEQSWHDQDTGAYKVAILIDDDPAFASPAVWFNQLSFDGVDTSQASASTGPSSPGAYVQDFAHFDPNGSSVTLDPSTTYTMRVYPYDASRSGLDNGTPYSDVVLWDDFTVKAVGCPSVLVAPAMTLTKIADNDTDRKIGEMITYVYTVQNTGEVDIEDVSVSDQHTTASGTAALTVFGETGDGANSAVSSDAAQDGSWDLLAPNDIISFSSTYVVTEGDIVAGNDLTTTATVTGVPTEGSFPEPITAKESVSVAMSSADLSLTKTNSAGVNGDIDEAADRLISGDRTTYVLTVTNNGPDRVTGALVTDNIISGLTCAATNLVTITGDGIPSGSFTVADLTGAGITLGSLADTEATTLSYDCIVN